MGILKIFWSNITKKRHSNFKKLESQVNDKKLVVIFKIRKALSRAKIKIKKKYFCLQKNVSENTFVASWKKSPALHNWTANKMLPSNQAQNKINLSLLSFSGEIIDVLSMSIQSKMLIKPVKTIL